MERVQHEICIREAQQLALTVEGEARVDLDDFVGRTLAAASLPRRLVASTLAALTIN